MRRVALKHLAIMPDEYWLLTPAELGEMLVGAGWRDEQDWERAAWMVAHLMNIEGKVLPKGKKVTPDSLLGRKKKPKKPQNIEADFKELVRRQQMIDERMKTVEKGEHQSG